MTLRYRIELPTDREAIYEVQRSAFKQHDEARLVDRLRDDGELQLSFVAELDGQIVGHVAYSRLHMVAGSSQAEALALALAPLAVSPTCQRQGIGAELVRQSLVECRQRGHRAVFVLGDPAYYQRFGFRAATVRHLHSPYAGEHFQGLELQAGALTALAGEVIYPAAFSAL